LRIDWIELSSAAHELPACMYAGADKDADETLRGWMRFPSTEWRSKSIFAIKQDVRLLNDNIARATLREPLADLVQRRKLRADQIDWFLPHFSSEYFVQSMLDSLDAVGLPIPRERWFSNLTSKGNTGSAAPYIMLDELFRSGRVEPGHKLLMFVPESGRFSSGFVHMEAV
jgi:3-oxoacyl-[acyl-carrier-protein] synthase III